MEFSSELQKQRVLIRWRRQAEKERNNSITDSVQRKILLARLIGYIQGDGSVVFHKEKNGRTHHNILFYPDHLVLAEIFVNAFCKLYGRKPKIKVLTNHFRVQVNHCVAYSELINLAIFNGLNWKVPLDILDNNQTKVEWLRALYDCEAYVGPRSIVVNSVSKDGLLQVQKLLQEFGIESRFYVYHRKQVNWNTNYILAINKISDRQSFLKQIGFNHPLKQKKLARILASVT